PQPAQQPLLLADELLDLDLLPAELLAVLLRLVERLLDLVAPLLQLLHRLLEALARLGAGGGELGERRDAAQRLPRVPGAGDAGDADVALRVGGRHQAADLGAHAVHALLALLEVGVELPVLLPGLLPALVRL